MPGKAIFTALERQPVGLVRFYLSLLRVWICLRRIKLTQAHACVEEWLDSLSDQALSKFALLHGLH